MLPKRYDHTIYEPELISFWLDNGINQFSEDTDQPIYSIDTPPATVSGNLHLGHVYSYTHPDIIARFWRMRGYRVFYPMGFDDNGLPTERLVEKRLGVDAKSIGRRAFIEKCLQLSEELETDYKTLWQQMGLSIDWRYTYRTIDPRSQRISQASFLDLFAEELVYRRESPTLWCPECQTAIAQAELNDLERSSEYLVINFPLSEGGFLAIATTRPELLPACVAIFIHPDDPRYSHLREQSAVVPLFGQCVPILLDSSTDPNKGTGAVMCCTFGDITDVNWWKAHDLPKIELIDRNGRLTGPAGDFSGQTLAEARKNIISTLENRGHLLGEQPTIQSIRVHERCDTPVEYISTQQWFIRILDFKEDLLEAGESIRWRPTQMKSRYLSWVNNLTWDWCISRQRYFGVPIPVWYCQACSQVLPAEKSQLPVDPTIDLPPSACPSCGSQAFIPEEDVLDTWATSSMTPQIAASWQEREGLDDLYSQVFPYSLRPQAHEIIRTWAFYTIVKSNYHFKAQPWRDVLISGWGIAGEGMGKISKSRGGGPMPPLEMIARYSADAVRYWAASTGPGKDSVISEEKIQNGVKFATKLWNIARFAASFLEGYQLPETAQEVLALKSLLTPADRWILSRLQSLTDQITRLLEQYDYAAAKSELEAFLWIELADNYLEMCKQRLYHRSLPSHLAALYCLHTVVLTLIRLLAPYMPFITEKIFRTIFAPNQPDKSIHLESWPTPDLTLRDPQAEQIGGILVEIATATRRYKSSHNLPLATEFDRLQLITKNSELFLALRSAVDDLISITRARQIEIGVREESALEIMLSTETLTVAGALTRD